MGPAGRRAARKPASGRRVRKARKARKARKDGNRQMGQPGETLQVRNEQPSLATDWGSVREPAPATSPVSIGAGCSFEGLMTFRGSIQVDGQLVGEVVATGTLRLGITACVRARIEVDELIVEGELDGDVVASQRIELSSTARVRGSLEAPRVSLAEGCLFQGRCRCVP